MGILSFNTLFILSFLIVCQTASAANNSTFTLWAPRENGSILIFSDQVFKLALDKTVAEYGPYQIEYLPYMTHLRAELYLQQENTNLFIDFNVTQTHLDRFLSIPFPIHLGIIGYRSFFVAPKSVNQLANVETLNDLKELTIGQGFGWDDVAILRNSGFNVVTTPHYESLFKMVSKNRFDLFSRGITELYDEFNARENDNPDLLYDTNICLYYPLPRFFFTNKSNALGLERIKLGINKAYGDGSYLRLWQQFYGESIKKANLKQRRIFSIENHLIKGISAEYKRYIYDPFRD